MCVINTDPCIGICLTIITWLASRLEDPAWELTDAVMDFNSAYAKTRKELTAGNYLIL